MHPFSYIFIILLLANLHKFLKIDRSSNGDKISGRETTQYCANQLESCTCPSAQPTLYEELPNQACVEDDTLGCKLQVDIGNSQFTKLYTATGSTTYSINISHVTHGTDDTLCFNENSQATIAPIFVRDYQNKFVWNAVFTSNFNTRLKTKIYDNGNTLQLDISSHWTGLLLKFHIGCGITDQHCVAIKFTGSRSYPLTEEIIKSVVGPLPTTSIPRLTSSLTTTVLLTTSTTPTTSATPQLTTTILPTISTTPATERTVSSTTNIKPTSSYIASVSSTVIITKLPEKGAATADDNHDHIIISVVVVVVIIIIIIIIVILLKKRRDRRKDLQVEENEKKGKFNGTTSHASIRHFNSMGEQRRMSSTPSLLNTQLFQPSTMKSSGQNPIYETETENGSSATNTITAVSPRSEITLSPMTSTSDRGGFDNNGYSSLEEDYYRSTDNDDTNTDILSQEEGSRTPYDSHRKFNKNNADSLNKQDTPLREDETYFQTLNKGTDNEPQYATVQKKKKDFEII